MIGRKRSSAWVAIGTITSIIVLGHHSGQVWQSMSIDKAIQAWTQGLNIASIRFMCHTHGISQPKVVTKRIPYVFTVVPVEVYHRETNITISNLVPNMLGLNCEDSKTRPWDGRLGEVQTTSQARVTGMDLARPLRIARFFFM